MSDEMTLKEAREIVQAGLESGITCLCCDRYVKTYKRRLNATTVKSLIWLYGLSSPDKVGGKYRKWVDVPDVAPKEVLRTKQLSTLRYWELIEPFPKTPGLPAPGRWRVTELGEQFVRGEVTVPALVHLYDGDVIGHSQEQTTLEEALGVNFDYAETLGL